MDDDAILALIRHQHGLITRQQALDHGLKSHQVKYRVRSARWLRIATGVYRHALWRPTWHARVMSFCLALRAVASHRTAAVLHRIDGFRPGRVEVVIDYRLHRPAVDAIVHQSTQIDRVDLTIVDGIPTTGLARTTLDVAAVVGRRRLEATFDSVLRDGRLSLEDLAAVLDRHARRGRDGCGKYRTVLDGRISAPAVPMSDWSRDVANLLVRHGVPLPVMEHSVVDHNGKLLGRVDLAYPKEKLGIELDSVRWHLNRESFERDTARRTALSVAGWTILNFTWRYYRDTPRELCGAVGRALTVARGRNLGAEG